MKKLIIGVLVVLLASGVCFAHGNGKGGDKGKGHGYDDGAGMGPGNGQGKGHRGVSGPGDLDSRDNNGGGTSMGDGVGPWYYIRCETPWEKATYPECDND